MNILHDNNTRWYFSGTCCTMRKKKYIYISHFGSDCRLFHDHKTHKQFADSQTQSPTDASKDISELCHLKQSELVFAAYSLFDHQE